MQRERLTITLEPDLIAAADGLIDKSSIRNRSHALEHLIKEGLGLHLLRQAFFFVGSDWEPTRAQKLIDLCAAQGISTVFLCVNTGEAAIRADLRLLIGSQAPQINLVDVPLDFGSGGAVLLQKAALAHPFLLAWLRPSLAVPASLVGAFATQRTGNTVTQLLISADGKEYHESGLAIASPGMLAHVPAGIVSLEETVFPELLKLGKVATYAFSI